MAKVEEDKKDKKDKKGRKGRKEFLQSMATKGTGVSRQYLKYGDIDSKNVHEGDVTYRGNTLTNFAPLANYAMDVWRAEGKEYFIHRKPGSPPNSGALYKSASGGNATAVKT
jgi:hypothetical protein